MMKLKLMMLISAVLLFLASPSYAKDGYQISTSTSGTFIKAYPLDNNQTVVIAEGRLEPRSIGTMSIKLYADLNVGDFIDGLIIARDGTILSVAIESEPLRKITITTVTTGSGNYENTQLVCINNDSLSLC
ncbi:PliI family lysozyme inhibitor of I-type lysozyme [Shewanella sp. 10N.286.52.B9]|uniref:PliI family lysozyme inhibitor of I-type lysozyme n=1 Tax=Shewanella sp. 10N.286.52.B9 TaxID=1880837 RepID=UPI000C861F50|nr:PliI family lysozyme inhibitor of I-type lysozyme [Shewanella sp. 10N.286.52.B9]